MAQYKIISEDTALRLGVYFFANSVTEPPIETGELALFAIGDQHGDQLIVGRWYPNIGGYDWILQPDRLIRVAKGIILWILGRIVPLQPQPCMN